MKISWKEKEFYMSSYWMDNLKNYVKGVMKKNTSAVFIFDGRSGLGKTTLACQTGCFLNNEIKKYMGSDTPLFNLGCLHWNPHEFLDRLEKAKKGEIIILDEAMIVSNRAFMSEINRMVVIMMSMIRSKQIFVIFCANSIFDLEKNLPLHRADVLIHLYAKDDRFATRGQYMVVPSAKGKLKMLYILGKKYYDYSKGKPAFIDHFSKFFPFSHKEYEIRKQKSINTYFETLGKKGTTTKIKQSRDGAIRYLKENTNMEIKELGIAFNVSEKTIYRVLKPHNDY